MIAMRVFEVFLRSGAKAELQAEILHDDSRNGDKIYFYGDNSLNQIVAYFNRADVAGVVFGPDKATQVPRRKVDVFRG